MPCGVVIWIDNQPDKLVIHVDKSMITKEGARLLAAAFNSNIHRWCRAPKDADRPALTLHTG